MDHQRLIAFAISHFYFNFKGKIMRKLDAKLLKENVDSRINRDIAENKVGACEICVTQNNDIVYRNAYNVKENSLYRLASMTKPITAVATLIQASRGALDIYDEIDKYLPAFSKMKIAQLDENGNIVSIKDAKNKIRIIHLLTHTSGVGSMEIGNIQSEKMTAKEKSDLSAAVDFFADKYLSFEPYSAQYYSPCAAFDILARIVEITAQKDFNTFLKSELFNPLQMNNTVFIPTQKQWSEIVPMHDLQNGKSVVVPMLEDCMFGDCKTSYFCGGAGLASNVEDYTRFARMLLNRGQLDGVRIIPCEFADAMQRAHLPSDIMPPPIVWGLGVRVITDNTYKALPTGSFGWSGAYGTHFWIDPANKITAVYLKNSMYDGGADAVTAYNFEIDVNNSFCH